MQNNTPTNQLYQAWKSNYVRNIATGSFVNSNDHKSKEIALSESQGYGMLITILAAEQNEATQEDFDQFVKYYQNHNISKENHLMAWKQIRSGNKMKTLVENNTNATDGDMDIAYALLMADQKWQSDGKYNYKKIAISILDDLLHYNYNDQNELLNVGNWAKKNIKYENLIRTSDLVPTYFKKFYEVTNDSEWWKIYLKSINVLQNVSNQNDTGLIPDFIIVKNSSITNVAPNTFESADDNNYGWNANRVPMRLSFDTSNQQLLAINKKLLNFFNQQNQIKAVYQLNGKEQNDYSSMAFTAPLAVAAYQQKSEFKTLSNDLLKQVNNSNLSNNYYADTLKMLAALMIEHSSSK
ncbi:glucanase [Leuconostoc litchii]|uniref:Glucanase n=1 Tax=Leuconostoc litchii TaxID=1981069 RepID=A0A6P2CJV7_9LACO|nr:glycosyl hydrolase family 8 [Leuconostoc litchii]TYC46191.1 licheninase [Leuconostoc litchii]GMA70351.1 glucanase [Leuconostoc litchii]